MLFEVWKKARQENEKKNGYLVNIKSLERLLSKGRITVINRSTISNFKEEEKRNESFV